MRRKLISSTGLCYRCLAAGHHSKECPNAFNGCTSTSHSSYLHDNTLSKTGDWSHDRLRSDAPPFRPPAQPRLGIGASQVTGAGANGSASQRQQNPEEQTYRTRHTERVSLMILPWRELKKKWLQLCHMPFGNASMRRQVDVMISIDHPVFHPVLKETCENKPNDLLHG